MWLSFFGFFFFKDGSVVLFVVKCIRKVVLVWGREFYIVWGNERVSLVLVI